MLPDPRFQDTLARLHLTAVLPAMGELVKHSAPAAEIVRQWHFPLRLRLRGGPQATLRPDGSSLNVSTDPQPGSLTLNFLGARQLNRTFLNKPAWPPIPSGSVQHLVGLQRFTKLTKLLDKALQPTEEALRDDEFLSLHLRLLFSVLIGALPVIVAQDGAVAHAMHTTPSGVAEIRMDALGCRGWARWDGTNLASGAGEPPSPPDVRIAFRDTATATAALRSQLDATAAVGLGNIRIGGLVPLADGLSVAMDKVESYLKPAA